MHRGLSIIGPEHSHGLYGSRIFDPTQLGPKWGGVELQHLPEHGDWGGEREEERGESGECWYRPTISGPANRVFGCFFGDVHVHSLI